MGCRGVQAARPHLSTAGPRLAGRGGSRKLTGKRLLPGASHQPNCPADTVGSVERQNIQ